MCAGVGHYLGVDPVLVRIALVALALAGGSGLIAYGIAWVVIPKAEPGEPLEPIGDATSSSSTATIAAIIGLALGASMLFGGSPFGGPLGGVLPLLLVAGGVALLLQRRDPIPAGDVPGPGVAAPSASLAGSDAPSPTFVDDWSSTWFAPVSDPALTGVAATSIPTTTSGAGSWAARRRRLPDRRVPFTLFTLSVLAVLGAGALALAELGWASPSWPGAFAVALVVVGAVLVVSAFVGRARWLVVVGLACLVGLAVSSTTQRWADDGVGERTVVPTLASLEQEQRHGIGRFVVDLRSLPLVEGTRTARVRLGMGSIEVLVPEQVDVELRAHGGAAAVTGPDGVTEAFLDDEDRRTFPGTGPAGERPTLVLDVELGVGSVEVERG